MKKAAASFFVFMIVLTGYIFIKHDLGIKKKAKESMIDLCSNFEHIDKDDIEKAIEALDVAQNKVMFLNVDQEEKASKVVGVYKHLIYLAQENLTHAEDLAKKDKSDYTRELSRKYVEEKKEDLNNQKKALSEKMKVVLGAYN